MKLAYNIFHANLAFSAIPEGKLIEVIDKCYFPLLNLIKKKQIKIALEISAYSLEVIKNLRPLWLDEFKLLHSKGLIELIGSGYIQIIAPLVPYEVNIKNQELGLQIYKKILGIKPTIAFINEQTFSKSLVDLYVDMGYEAIIMEWNNAYTINESFKQEYSTKPIIVEGIRNKMPLLWSDTILFQQFQRTIHMQQSFDKYISFIRKYTQNNKAVAIYSSDLEIFNFRPGRFETEELIKADEWKNIEIVLDKLEEIFLFELPSKIVEKLLDKDLIISLTNEENPIIVKKQVKYSLSRWAACGRGANFVNTLCFNYLQKISESTNIKEWKTLLKYWGSDYRTHITKDKWEKAITDLKFLTRKEKEKKVLKKLDKKHFLEKEDKILFIKENIKILFNKKKGLTLDSLYKDEKKLPFGTIEHGELDYIKHGADFYTGTTVIESVQTKKISDLIEIENYSCYEMEGSIYKIEAKLHMKDNFTQVKSWIINLKEKSLSFDLKLNIPKFINGTIRVGTFTLNKDFALNSGYIKFKNGSNDYEIINLKTNELNQHLPKSLIQSSNSGIGCTNGEMIFYNKDFSFKIKLNRNISYPFIMLQNNKDKYGYLTRIHFSLQELDDTLKVNEIREYTLNYKVFY